MQCLGVHSGLRMIQRRSHTVVTTMKSICRLKGSRWQLTIGEHNLKDAERGKLKRSPLKKLTTFKELQAFAKSVRTLRRSRGVSAGFTRNHV